MDATPTTKGRVADAVATLRTAAGASKPAALNALVPLLSADDGGGASQDVEQAETTFAALQAVHRCLAPYVAQGVLKRASSGSGNDTVERKLRVWLRDKYEAYWDVLLAQLENHPEPGIQVPVLGWLIDLVALESAHQSRQAGAACLFSLDLLERVTYTLACSSRLNDHVVRALADKHVNDHDDLRYYFLRALTKTIERFETDTPSETVLENLFTLLRDVVDMPTDKNGIKGKVRVSSPLADATPKPAYTKLASVRKTFEDAWLRYLRLPLTSGLYKRVLVILYKEIYPHLLTPALLIDFLTESFSAGGVASLLSLNTLFMLMTKHNLDYPSFYERLYNTFDEQTMTVKYRARFFRMADTFLSSTHLPAYLVAAFIKRLARLSLVAPPPATLVNLVFIHNLLLRHPQCLVMIHRTSSQMDQAVKGEDPYLEHERDPAKSCAIDASLWELLALKDHYEPSVARLAASFEQPLRQVPYNLDEYLDKSLDSLFTSAVKRKFDESAVLNLS